MDTKALMIFIKLSELGSLNRASLALEITNSTISRQLAQLETQCGGKLFFVMAGVLCSPRWGNASCPTQSLSWQA